MPPWVIVSVFSALALAACWGLYSAWTTGVANDEAWTFKRDANPAMYSLTLAGKATVLCFSVAMVLHAMGLIQQNPVEELQRLFPFLPSRTN
jgi:ABC-type Fe3+ transport system permease subunit